MAPLPLLFAPVRPLAPPRSAPPRRLGRSATSSQCATPPNRARHVVKPLTPSRRGPPRLQPTAPTQPCRATHAPSPFVTMSPPPFPLLSLCADLRRPCAPSRCCHAPRPRLPHRADMPSPTAPTRASLVAQRRTSRRAVAPLAAVPSWPSRHLAPPVGLQLHRAIRPPAVPRSHLCAGLPPCVTGPCRLLVRAFSLRLPADSLPLSLSPPLVFSSSGDRLPAFFHPENPAAPPDHPSTAGMPSTLLSLSSGRSLPFFRRRALSPFSGLSLSSLSLTLAQEKPGRPYPLLRPACPPATVRGGPHTRSPHRSTDHEPIPPEPVHGAPTSQPPSGPQSRGPSSRNSLPF
ncbi:vegetative cell wall protein gp1-like [Phragmites australis]|uniref:vegetative cell wall protein gp1-like n=1 Tax=Phragmites australis TaxID=29695 RepID=UPI002D77D273|nr:vegetative cell wall protein gp1-like [Phragmites australis]